MQFIIFVFQDFLFIENFNSKTLTISISDCSVDLSKCTLAEFFGNFVNVLEVCDNAIITFHLHLLDIVKISSEINFLYLILGKQK
jgi:hypothetical protein